MPHLLMIKEENCISIDILDQFSPKVDAPIDPVWCLDFS